MDIDEDYNNDVNVNDNEDYIDSPKSSKKKTAAEDVDEEDEDLDDDEEDEDIDEEEEDEDEEEGQPDNEDDVFAPLRNNTTTASTQDIDLDDLSDEEDEYLQKIDEELQQNFLQNYHPELIQHNHEEVEAMTKITRNSEGVIVDPLHKTMPFITRYEKAKIIGERTKQLETGGIPFVKTDVNTIDGYLIALKELEEKKIPFIIKRPLPNGACEYWKLEDLEVF